MFSQVSVNLYTGGVGWGGTGISGTRSLPEVVDISGPMSFPGS